MLLIGIITPFLLGILIILLVKPKSTLCEFLGLSFLIGMFVQTVFMVLIDACSVPITQFSILIADFIFLCLLVFFLRKRGLGFETTGKIKQRFIQQLKSFNFVWLLVIGFIVWYEYLNLEKCLYFPTFDRDSLVGFDTIGYVISQEHTLKGLSIFNADYVPSIRQAGSYISYAPFVQLSYAYVYLFGALTSKLIPALIFLSFIIGFYAVMTKCLNKTGAALISLLMFLTPQLLAFSSISSTNVMHAAFASLGTIYGLQWLKTHQKGDFLLSAILLAANVWTRSEGLIFIVAVGFPILLQSIRTKTVIRSMGWLLMALIPFFGWSLYQRITGLYADSFFITQLFWDHEKMSLICKYLFNNFANISYYGWTFSFLLISLIINLWYLIKNRDNLTTLLVLVGSIALYTLILYQIDYVWDTIQNVLQYSTKRFIFCFVPIAWYYASTNKVVASFLLRADKWMNLHLDD